MKPKNIKISGKQNHPDFAKNSMLKKQSHKSSDQQELSAFQQFFLKNMAEPQIQASGAQASPQIKAIALERRKAVLSQQPVYNTLNQFITTLERDQEDNQIFTGPRLRLSDFDNDTYSTRPYEGWKQFAKQIQLANGETKTGLYATVFTLKRWNTAVILGCKTSQETNQRSYVVSIIDDSQFGENIEQSPINNDQNSIKPGQLMTVAPLFCFIWGEDLGIYVQRLQAALYARNQAEAVTRFTQYYKKMPTDQNSNYPPNLRQEIAQNSIPGFQQHDVLSFTADVYQQIKDKVVGKISQLVDKSSEYFLTAQNRIILEQMLELSPSLISERHLELLKDKIVNEKANIFCNIARANDVYRQLITSGTLMSFVPANAQYDDDGNPLVTIEELQRNVGAFLSKSFETHYNMQERQLINSVSVRKYQKQLNNTIQQLNTTGIRSEILQQRSLAQNYQNRELTFDEIKYNYLCYAIVQKATVPKMPESFKIYTLDEYKLWQQQHQQNTKNFIEFMYMDQIRQLVLAQLSRYDVAQINNFEDYEKMSNVQKYFKLINLQVADQLSFLAETSFAAYDAMFQQQTLWSVECKSCSNVKCRHRDAQNCDLTVYLQPIFQIYVNYQEAVASVEEKHLAEKLEESYVYDLPSLIQSARGKLKLSESDDEGDEAQDSEEAPDQYVMEDLEAEGEDMESNADRKQRLEAAAAAFETEELRVKQFAYLTSPNDYVAQALDSFDSGLSVVQNVLKIEQLSTKLPFTEKQYLKVDVGQLHQEYRAKVEESLKKLIQPLDTYLQQFTEFRNLLFLDEDKFIQTVRYRAEMYVTGLTAPKDFEMPQFMTQRIDQLTPLAPNELKELSLQYQRQSEDLMVKIPDQMHLGVFMVVNTEVRKHLVEKCIRISEQINRVIEHVANGKASQVVQLYNAICRKLNKKPKNIEECCKLSDFIGKNFQKLKTNLLDQIKSMNEYYAVLDLLLVFQQNNQTRWKVMEFVTDLDSICKRTQLLIENQRNIFKSEQFTEQDQLVKSTDGIQHVINQFAFQFTRLDDYEEAYKQSQAIVAQLTDLMQKATLFNKREQLMNLPKTDYSNIGNLQKEFEPQQLLWTCVAQFNKLSDSTNNDDFKLVNANQVVEQTDQCFKDISKCIRNVKEGQIKVRELAEEVKTQIIEFKKELDLLAALRNTAMRRRHWIQLSKLTGIDLRHLRYINGVENKVWQKAETTENASELPPDEEKSETDYSQMSQEQIDELNKMPVNYTFKMAKNVDGLGEPKNLAIIKQISNQASAQFMIEKTILELEQLWSGINFQFAEYQNSGCYILKSLDDIIQKLDDSITLIQSMQFAPFKEFFLGSINYYESTLTQASEILDVWIQVQQAWLYLEPIFNSADISRQLPTESRIFRQVDGQFKTFMSKAYKIKNVVQITKQIKDVLKMLKQSKDDLEKVQKGLADYLETKRIAFPRFFFLADEELLQILSNTKNPSAVQPFLRSCFENVARIKIIDVEVINKTTNEPMIVQQIISMNSHEGEQVDFVERLVPTGQVENWMTQLEELILRTVKAQCKMALMRYFDMVSAGGVEGRARWVRSGFAQGINIVNQMAFCNDTEFAINGNYLQKYNEQLNNQLLCMTDLVREGLSKQDSKTFSAVLTYDVFQRDVVQGLIKEKVTTTQAFSWLSHPKHYCNVDEFYTTPIHGKDDFFFLDAKPEQSLVDEYLKKIETMKNQANGIADDQFLISYNQILSTLPYAFEYLGNTPRLVITPLTLKIYSTISQSQAMYKFSSCSGPAGSGKTETSKQTTNKELGLVCIVFNCSEGLDLIGIKRMLSGVISSGGCLIMDEINRLSLDVLSVFAQMVLGVQLGLQQCGGCIVSQATTPYGKAMAAIQKNKYLFESTELNLQSTATVIITQNPNYSGRQKLPANLVALFRAVSVMVPNYNKICQIRLYSFGFKNATSLAQKAVSVFKLCSEQLSQQSWYDYGMRAINSTIQAAGNIKLSQNSNQGLTEDQIVLRAVSEVNSPKFLQNDAFLFENILKDLFPGVEKPKVDYAVFQAEMAAVLRSNQMNYLQPEDKFLAKANDLFMTIGLRHGVMELGCAASGKTACLYGLMNALNRLNKREYDERMAIFMQHLKASPTDPLTTPEINKLSDEYTWQRTAIQRLNPKSITMDQLFGQFDAVSKEWQDGVLSTLVRNAVQDYNKHTGWVEQTLYKSGYNPENGNPTLQDINPDTFIQKNNYTRQIVLSDGYIDSLWIESLNTVLDDSKRLCLTSGEIICLTPVMNMLFIMDSVAEASPATISRNGMLYFTGVGVTQVEQSDGNTQLVQTGDLSPDAYIQTFIDNLPDQIRLNSYEPSAQASLKQEFITKFNQPEEQLSNIGVVFQELLGQFAKESIAFVNAKCKMFQQVVDANLFQALFRLLNTFLAELKPNEFGVVEPYAIDAFNVYQEPIFFFCLTWSVGAVICDQKGREAFDKWLRSRISELTYLQETPYPDEIDGNPATVFDFMLVYDSYEMLKEKSQQDTDFVCNIAWKPWGYDQLKNINFDQIAARGGSTNMARINLGELIVPTAGNIQQQYLIKKLITASRPTLLVGNTGSGKTAVVKNYLMNDLQDAKVQIPLLMTFSANTQAGNVQEFLDGKLEKRRRGVFGPPSGKRFVLFVDDLNLPAKERYGCINSHEFMRSIMAHDGWYDLKLLQFKTVVDTIQLCAMCPAGGSRNDVSQRLLRHYNIINFLDMDQKQLRSIFGQVIEWWTNKQFSPDVVKEINQKLITTHQKLTQLGINIYDKVCLEMLPTPSKEHYTFNMRDLSKLFQGFMMIQPESVYLDPEESKKQNQPIFKKPDDCANQVLKLFVHEVNRVFGDRLITQQDRDWLTQTIDEGLFSQFNIKLANLFKPGEYETLMYGDFITPQGLKPGYQQITDSTALLQKLHITLSQCNDEIGGMNLVLFEMAVQHLARIVRILRQDNSNILLIGLGGVGRQSLSKLAAFHLNYEVRQIEVSKSYGISEWRASVKSVLMDCGLRMKQIVFLLSDQHIFDDKQLEDISILLNTCDLQSIYELADMNEILDNDKTKEVCRSKELPPTKQNLYDCYLKNVRMNIHIVLCFSPSGSTLRTRLRKFPALVNCCSIDYFENWPREAMQSVGMQVFGFTGDKELAGFDALQLEEFGKFLEDQCKVNNWDIPTTQKRIIDFFVDAYALIEQQSELFKEELGRFNHVTPTLYLNCLKQFYDIVIRIYNKSNTYKLQLSSGLDTLKDTQIKVQQLEVELKERQPELIKISKSVDELMVQLEIDKKEAEQTKVTVTKEKMIAAQKFQECDSIKQEADREMAQVQPLLDEAIQVVKELNKNDLIVIASYQSPAQAIREVLDTICILMRKKPKKTPDPAHAGQFIEDYWDEAKKLLQNYVQLKEDLTNYEKEKITLEMVNKLKTYIEKPYFNREEMRKKSEACAGLCAYVNAMYKFYFVNLNVIPKREKQAAAQAELEVVERGLREAEAKLDAVNQRIADLEAKFTESLNKKEQLQQEVEECAKKLERAQTLMISLGGEQTRWTQQLAEVSNDIKNVLSSALVSTATVIFAGAFTSQYRTNINKELIKLLFKYELYIFKDEEAKKTLPEMQITQILSDQVTLMNYVNTYKLPSDNNSMQNAVILFNSQKYCLLIDPEQQGLAFLKNYYKEQGVEVAKANDQEVSRTITNSLRFGKILIITNIENEIDKTLLTIIEQKYVKENGQLGLNMDGNFVPVSENFKLFLCTHLNNPNYKPEQFVKLTVVNFAITIQGLQDQLLGLLFQKEQREQEEQKNQLLIQNSQMKVQLQELEQEVLKALGENDTDILSNESLIEKLSLSQKTSKEIHEKVQESEVTERNIDAIRQEYVPMARRGSILYFVVQDMQRIDYMYQFSLGFYMNLYSQSIDMTEQASDRNERLKLLIDHFTLFMYQVICRSLFDEHKLLFSLMIALRIQLSDNEIQTEDLRFLLVRPTSSEHRQNPCPNWLQERSWQQLLALQTSCAAFSGIADSFSDLSAQETWKKVFESSRPEAAEFPPQYEKCTPFQRFLPIACLRPDRVLAYARLYIEKQLGSAFIQPQVLNIPQSYKESNNLQPLLFLLGDMADPIADLMAFAEQMKMSKRIQVLSLGRGVEKAAVQLVLSFAEKGNWCVLQNCHLCTRFLKMLDQTLEQLQQDSGTVSRDFRLWLTSQPTPEFPVQILQNSVKISVENPNDMKANLLRVYQNNVSEQQLTEACKEPIVQPRYKRLAYSLAVFYAVLLQRKKYGAIGFNTPYPWSAADIGICIAQAPIFLDKYVQKYPKEAFQYLFAGINVGGCVTDATDQRTVDAIVEDFLDERALQDGWLFQTQKVLQEGQDVTKVSGFTELSQPLGELGYQDYIEHIQQNIPIEVHPNNLGLNANSNITSDIAECGRLMDNVLTIQAGALETAPSGGGRGKSAGGARENPDIKLIEGVRAQCPELFDLDAVQLKYPTVFEESLNALLCQECGRYNLLLEQIKIQTAELLRALQGQTIMSDELDRVLQEVKQNRIPESFAKMSYPSLKPLSSYMEDLKARCLFFKNWVDAGKPKVYPINLFFFTQGFLTSVLQNFARKYQIAIDTIEFGFTLTDVVLDDAGFVSGGNLAGQELLTGIRGAPGNVLDEIGDITFVSGLYLEAARLDENTLTLTEARPRELYYKMPIIKFIPRQRDEGEMDKTLYDCPCYRTTARFGTLSTTGHSTNFLLNVSLPCAEGTRRHWIKRSVAMFAGLSD